MTYLLTAALSGAFAAAVAVTATMVIERLGGRVGGVLASSPTTVIPASLGVAASCGIALWGPTAGGDDSVAGGPTPRVLEVAMLSIPVGLFASVAFLYAWRVVPPRCPDEWPLAKRLAVICCAALTVWLGIAGAGTAALQRLIANADARGSPSDGITSIALLGAGCIVTHAVSGLWICFQPIPAPKGLKAVSWRVLALRGCLSGLFVFCAVNIAHLSPVAAAMATAFPAVFGTIMLSLYVHQGPAVQGGATGPLILGALSIAAYVNVFAFSASTLGSIPACVIAYGFALSCVSLPVSHFLYWRRHGGGATSSGAAGGEVAGGGSAGATSGGAADVGASSGGSVSGATDGVALRASCSDAWDDTSIAPAEGAAPIAPATVTRQVSLSAVLLEA